MYYILILYVCIIWDITLQDCMSYVKRPVFFLIIWRSESSELSLMLAVWASGAVWWGDGQFSMFHDHYHLKMPLAAGVTLGKAGIRHTHFAISKPQSLPAAASSFSFSQTPHINSDRASVYSNLTAYLFYMFLVHCSRLKDIIKDTDLPVFWNRSLCMQSWVLNHRFVFICYLEVKGVTEH